MPRQTSKDSLIDTSASVRTLAKRLNGSREKTKNTSSERVSGGKAERL